MDEEQLVNFCHQLGLAKDGYLNQSDLSVVCRCIGLVASDEMMKQLFEELDGDNDGRVCLAELSLMLRGMQLQSKKSCSSSSSSTTISDKKHENPLPLEEILPIPDVNVNEHCAFSVLDPEHKGFAKVGCILDFWSQLGIHEEISNQILKELGFSTQKLTSINLQDLCKSIDDETTTSTTQELNNTNLPPIFHIALITYRTETQYLRQLNENIGNERDKLRSDILEAHQRTEMLAQEIDEQNTRLEKSSQIQLQKITSKYTEQIQQLQKNMSVEKESLQQIIQQLELQLNSLNEDIELNLKIQITKLKCENLNLENEVKNLTKEVQHLNQVKEQFQEELTRFLQLEQKLQEVEKQNLDKELFTEQKLQKKMLEIQSLKDQNDELSTQLERMKDTVKSINSSEGKRFDVRRRQRRRRNKEPSTSHNNNKQGDTDTAMDAEEEEDIDVNCVPMEKIGKFHQDRRTLLEHDGDDAESSLEHVFVSCSEPESMTAISAATVAIPVQQNVQQGITLAGIVTDETCTEEIQDQDMHSSHPNQHQENSIIETQDEESSDSAAKQIQEEYKSLQIQLAKLKQRIQGILANNKQEGVKVQMEILLKKCPNCNSSDNNEFNGELAQQTKAENEKLKTQCKDLENSLELLQIEYEKCEEYWHGKLQEERIEYEHDRNINEDKFYELSYKIKEYEEMFLQQNDSSTNGSGRGGIGKNNSNNKLPPIEERASLEQQVNDLDAECNCLREQLQSVKYEHDSVLTNYQRNWELKLNEECNNLEQQVKALQLKCQEYEIRLTSITEEEQIHDRNDGKDDLITSMRNRIENLEKELIAQKEKHTEHIQHLDQAWKQRNNEKSSQDKTKKSTTGTTNGPLSCDTHQQQQQKADLLEMLHSPQPPQYMDALWSQQAIPHTNTNFYPANVSVAKTSSLPFIPVNYNYTATAGVPQNNVNTNSGQWVPYNQYDNYYYNWTSSTTTTNNYNVQQQQQQQSSKKAWCHVEVGWLQALRTKLQQREEQCLILQNTLCQIEQQHDKMITEIKYQHSTEIANWESLMRASQDLVRQQTVKQKEQTEQLVQNDLLMKDLWTENTKLVSALNLSQQRVLYLETLLQEQQQQQQGGNGNMSTSSYSSAVNFNSGSFNIPQIGNFGGDNNTSSFPTTQQQEQTNYNNFYPK